MGKRIIATVINDVHFDQRMIKICSTMQEAGYKVTLVGRKQYGYEPETQTFAQKRLSIWPSKGIWFYVFYNIRLFLLLVSSKVDIIHAVDMDTLGAAYLAAKLRHKKLVYDAHELFSEVPELAPRILKKKIWRKAEDFFIPRVPHTITVSESIASYFQKLYVISPVVIRNVPYRLTPNLQKSEEKFILYQGALNEGRGLEMLISLAINEKIMVKIAGEGPLTTKLKLLANEDKNVAFLGNISPFELKTLTQKAQIGYNLLENKGLSYYFSLSNKFFDYMWAGIPSVNSNFPEYQKITSQYSCGVCIDFDYTALRDEIKLLWEDTNYYEKIKKSCVLAQEMFCWENESVKLLDFYKTI